VALSQSNIATYLTAVNPPAFGASQPAALVATDAYNSCSGCGYSHRTITKFCTKCGKSLESVNHQSEFHPAPVFAQVQAHEIPKQLQDEMGRVLIAIARERCFLYFHWTVFLVVHGLGFWLAFEFYSKFIADEFTKTLIALVPICFFNFGAFFCLQPIKSTRYLISRLKEELVYLHYQIEYRDLW
jgi:hypothetical protein